MYLRSFTFPSSDDEFDFILTVKRTCFDSYYPFRVLGKDDPTCLEFEPVTFLYGGNGSGKSTALNVIAEALRLDRDALFNRGSFFEEYIGLCRFETSFETPENSRIITSDDVFDFMLNMRMINDGISMQRELLFKDYLDRKYSSFKVNSIQDYESLKLSNSAKSRTQSKYIRSNLMLGVREHSNGENALKYFMEKIEDNGLYLLDEPENSLSPERQLELKKFIEDEARFFSCQFIIATHSPFLLSIEHAKIYDMDDRSVSVRKWTELGNVRIYQKFFKEHSSEFREH